MSGRYCDKCGYDYAEHMTGSCPPPFLSDFRGGKSLLPEDKSVRCGYGPFSLPLDHPFTPACKNHDKAFEDKENKFPTAGRKAADARLLSEMLTIAKDRNSTWLKFQAYLFYGLARVFGKVMW